MIEREDVVAAVVAAAGGRLTGRVRMQKVIYLLDRLGLKSGFEYEYHHYGPYSRELDLATADAQVFLTNFREDFDYRLSDGARYSVFTFSGRPKTKAYGDLSADRVHELMGKFNQTNVTVLELAATIDWLWREEKVADWRREVGLRKSVKVQNGRLERAEELLKSLNLKPDAVPAAH
jgi:uncharacterized protein